MDKSYDVVIVLNGGAGSDGRLFHDTKQRVITGMQIAKKLGVPRVLMAGRESKKMRDFALVQENAHGLELLVDDASRNTIENAHYSKINFLDPNKWNSVIVVTDKFHSDRAQYTFERVLGNTYKVKMIESDAGYSKDQAKELGAQEQFFTRLTKEMLQDILPGDDAKRQVMLQEKKEVTSDYFTVIRK